jgi:hypothetical protein
MNALMMGPWFVDDSLAHAIYVNTFAGRIATIEGGKRSENLERARLIAAAPELARYLAWALDAMAARNPVWTEGENYMAARDAIAKATRGAK